MYDVTEERQALQVSSSPSDLATKLAENLLGFCSTLKENGIDVSLSEIIELFEILQNIDVTNRADFYLGSRIALVKKAEDYPVFESVFNRYWDALRNAGSDDLREKEGKKQRRNELLSISTQETKAYSYYFPNDTSGRDTNTSAKLVTYSTLHTKRKGLFENVKWADYSKQKRTIRTLRRYLATMPGRRFQPSSAGSLDFRRTVRSNLVHGGDLLKIARRNKRVSKAKLLILCDVSGSMEGYTTDLLLTLQNFCKSSGATEVFAFSTEIARLTDYFRHLSLRSALATISEKIDFWGSGTKIGYCLRMFNSRFQGLVDNRTVVIVISDGWDIGEIDVLRNELIKIRNTASGLIWLNPLADQPGYEPTTAGMKAALDYVDLMGSTSILNDMSKLRRLLGKSIMMPGILLRHRTNSKMIQ